MSSNKRKWRLNYFIAYRNKSVAKKYREIVHQALISVATLRKIDFSIACEFPFFDESKNDLSTSFQDIVADLVYFRSSKDSLSSIKQFRTIVDQIFEGYFDVLKGDDFEVGSQMIKELPNYPFPKEFFRPLKHPYVQHHNGKEITLCATQANYETLLNDDLKKEQN